MRRRPAILAALLTITIAASTTVATAAVKARPKPKPPKPVCNLLTDDSGDGHSSIVSAVSSPALDILGGDLATGKTTMVAVLRLSSTDVTPTKEPFVALGFNWIFGATSSLGHSFVFKASHSATGVWISSAEVDQVGVQLTDFKVVGNTFVWTIKRSVAPSLVRPNNVFGDLRGTSSVFGSSADSAFSVTSRYHDRAPSCVPAL